MMHFLVFAALSAASWQFVTERDPLGQAVYVAKVTPDAARPFVSLKFECGGVAGVTLQFNLGTMASDFSTKEPGFEDVRFEFLEGKYDSAAQRAPLTDGIDTFEIKGSEAAFIAGLLADSDAMTVSRAGAPFASAPGHSPPVTVTRAGASFSFPLSGARAAIGEVKSACAYKYEDP